jgi:alpha-L-rhamnosidase
LHEVNLFRRTFSIEETLKKANLQIFADTRYQVWLDGDWVGRGPARFSKLTREYDVYPLGNLGPGEHLIAVLVQWAPNNRRSESTTPYLLAHIEGSTSAGHLVKAATGSFWKVLSSDAWRQEAALVHTWGLIGPTELLDLRQLPLDWMKLEYSDSGWSQAIVKNISTVDYQLPQVPRLDPSVSFTAPAPLLEPSPTSLDISTVNFLPRSLPFLDRVNIPIQVLDAGFVSPGRRISEIDGTTSERTIRVTALDETSITFETVAIDGPPISEAFRLDGRTLNWAPVGESRPDIYSASEILLKASIA